MTIPQRAAPSPILSEYVASTAQSSNFNSDPFNIQQYSHYALQTTITSESSLNVSVSVQVTVNNVDWVTVPGSAQSATTNTSLLWDFGSGGSGVFAARLAYTFSAGSAVFGAWGFSKI